MPIAVVTLAGDPDREAAVAGELNRRRELELSLRCVDRVDALAAVRSGSADVILAVGIPSWFDFQCVEEARRARIRLFGIAADPIEVEMLETAGFEVLPRERELDELPNHLAAPDAPPLLRMEPMPKSGKLIAVWGAKGAPGRTTIAVELAAVLAELEPATLLVDADLYGGDVLQMLGVVDELPGIVTVARMGARGELADPGWVAELRRSGPRGPAVLPGLLRADLWDGVSAFGWTEVLRAVSVAFRFAVCDVGFCLERARGTAPGPGRNDIALATVAAADHVVAVVRADPVGIRSFLWALSDAAEVIPREKLLLVANRVRRGEEAEVRSLIGRHVGRAPFALVPDRPDHALPAVWRGEPVTRVDPGSPIAVEARRIAAAVGGAVAPRGFLTRLSGRRDRV